MATLFANSGSFNAVMCLEVLAKPQAIAIQEMEQAPLLEQVLKHHKSDTAVVSVAQPACIMTAGGAPAPAPDPSP